MAQIQCPDLVQSQDTRHVDVKKGKLFFIDIIVQLGVTRRILLLLGSPVSGERDIRAFVELLGKFTSQWVPGV